MGRLRIEFRELPLQYSVRAQFLHQQGCYDGYIDEPDIPDLIYGTADYIRQAQQLASL